MYLIFFISTTPFPEKAGLSHYKFNGNEGIAVSYGRGD
uniref:Uncharacterized protein n=1 Tax=Phage sp. cty4N14 TaxID=2825799 RepID=A0A8S5U4X5_9VIRU|nr:MAG TPA: hypothetical protein [Phage sp. cty4N14]